MSAIRRLSSWVRRMRPVDADGDVVWAVPHGEAAVGLPASDDASPGETTVPNSDDEVNPLFTGKRSAERFRADLTVELRGPKVVLRAETVDLSQTGCRAKLAPEALKRLGPAVDAARLLAAVQRHFADGLEVFFPRPKIALAARVVRLAFEPGPKGEVQIAFRFTTDLTAELWTKLLL